MTARILAVKASVRALSTPWTARRRDSWRHQTFHHAERLRGFLRRASALRPCRRRYRERLRIL